MVAQMSTFTSTARKDGRWWVVQCDQHAGAVSQVAHLREAEEAQREAIAFVADLPQREIEVIVIPDVAPDLRDRLHRVEQLQRDAEQASTEAARVRREIARQLRDAGIPMRDIAALFHISHQRVAQLLGTDEPRAAAG